MTRRCLNCQTVYPVPDIDPKPAHYARCPECWSTTTREVQEERPEASQPQGAVPDPRGTGQLTIAQG